MGWNSSAELMLSTERLWPGGGGSTPPMTTTFQSGE